MRDKYVIESELITTEKHLFYHKSKVHELESHALHLLWELEQLKTGNTKNV